MEQTISESQQKMLNEKWNGIVEADKKMPITDTTKRNHMAVLLENTEQEMQRQGLLISDGKGGLMENQTVASNLGVFTPIILPTVRRTGPGTLAYDIAGVQAMNTPTGYAFAWRASYAGDNTGTSHSSSSALGLGAAVSPLDRGNWYPYTTNTAAVTGAQFASVILLFTQGAGPINASDIAVGDDVRDTTTGGGNVHGTVKYFEISDGVEKVLVDYVLSGSNPAFPITTSTNMFFETDNDVAYQAIGVVGNELMFNTILKGYTGAMTTATGESLGTAMKEIRTTMEKVTINAETRKLKASYSLEMAQDLKAMHGMDAEQELINIISQEVTSEIDRELVAAIRDNATAGTGWNYGTLAGNAQTASAGYADGQWELEKLRTLYTKIIKEANLIAKTTRRGAGNFVIASINVVSALENLSNFMYAQVGGGLSVGATVAKTGTLDGRFQVYCDTLWAAALDTCLVGFKGPGNMDAGVIYCPYLPLMLMRVTDPNTFQPSIGTMTRYGLAYNMYGTQNYYRKFSCTFTNSQFGGVQ